MKRTTRATAAAFVATLALGVSSPALATPGHSGDHPSHAHGTKPSKDDHKFAIDQRNALRQIAQLDTRIGAALADSRVGKLGSINDVDVKTAVLDNAAADRAALADTKAAVEAAVPGFDFKALRADLRQVRPENYRIVVNALRQATRIDAAADALGGFADVDTAINDAVAQAVLVTARSPKSDFAPIFAALEAAQAALDAAQAPVDPTAVDTDGDGLSDADEATLGTDPAVADTDGGGVSDGDEVTDGTDPLNPLDDIV
ncbi:MAG TPA: hypothetical protein VNS55_00010 [Nocardioides sp.]|nr:hypothetical protein [Nocardioides sp.]